MSHDILSSNYFMWALTPGRIGYAQAAIKGMTKDAFPSDEHADFQKTKERLDAWPEIKSKILNLADRVTSEFNPYYSGFDILSSFIPENDMLWLKDVNRHETIDRNRLEQWKIDGESAVEKVDSEFNNVRADQSTINELRSAVDSLIDIFSGKGYFRGN